MGDTLPPPDSLRSSDANSASTGGSISGKSIARLNSRGQSSVDLGGSANMAVEIVQSHLGGIGQRKRLVRMSLRSTLIAGVAAVGIVTALPDGPVAGRVEGSIAVVASSAALQRVSQYDVELMAYIPGWTDAMIAIDQIAYTAGDAVDYAVNSTLAVGSSIPFVNVFARQAYIIYNYLIWPVVWLPLTCGVLFAGTLDVGYLNHWISVTAQRFAGFVQAEANYFLYGGWNPFAAAATSAAADKIVAADNNSVDSSSAVNPDHGTPQKSGLAKSGRRVPRVGVSNDSEESGTATTDASTNPDDAAPQAGSVTPTRNAGSSRTTSSKSKNDRDTSSSGTSSDAGSHRSAGTGHNARHSQPKNN
ncbi:hypothetical protein ACRDU6_04050 [Mycolicibacterium sp. ELW1]|uniref:hypothetical protein n=1 Tax=Mycobacteriaceae TaxID=1762 RepID=UPI0011ED1E6A|nr:hypothetical protein [Mycobacterium sp. ELW1]QEN11954.1 hypothetical protein D3H54_00640 [Mycobacterium sp. ELW1]